MKKLIFVILFCFLYVFGFSQSYPLTQNIGSDSTLVYSKGALKSRLINITYTDTTSANAERISQYPGALLFTTFDNNFWIRNSTATKWLSISADSTIRFGVEDSLASEDRYFNSSNYDFTIDNIEKLSIIQKNVNGYSSLKLGQFPGFLNNGFDIRDSSATGQSRIMSIDPGTDNVITVIKNISPTGKIAELDFTDGYIQNSVGNAYFLGQDSIVIASAYSFLKLKKDSSISIEVPGGKYFTKYLKNQSGTKSLRYDPSTGLITYADTTIGGGGSINNANRGLSKSGDSLGLAVNYRSLPQKQGVTPYNNSFLWEKRTDSVAPKWYDGVRLAFIGDTLLKLGGWNNDVTTYTTDSIYYSVNEGTSWQLWSTRMPYPTHSFVLFRSPDDWWYMIGGDQYLTSTQRKTVTRTKDFRTWITMTTNAEFGDRMLAAGFADEDGNIYIMGGQSSLTDTTTGMNDVWMSTRASGGASWTQLQSNVNFGGFKFLGGNNYNTVQYLNRKVYVICGGAKYNDDPSQRTFSNKVFAIPIENIGDATKWVAKDTMPTTAMQYVATCVFNGEIAAGFGNDVVGNTRNFALFDGNKWHPFTNYLGLDKVTQVSPAHASAMIEFNGNLYRVQGNGVNQCYRLKMSNYTTGLAAKDSAIVNYATSISEEPGSLYSVFGNNLIAAGNQKIKIHSSGADNGRALLMGYTRGIWAVTGLTGAVGTTYNDTVNTAFHIDQNMKVMISNGSFGYAAPSGYIFGVNGKSYFNNNITTLGSLQQSWAASGNKKVAMFDTQGFLDTTAMVYNSGTKKFAISTGATDATAQFMIQNIGFTELKLKAITSGALTNKLNFEYDPTNNGASITYDANNAYWTYDNYFQGTASNQQYGDIFFRVKKAGGSTLSDVFRIRGWNGYVGIGGITTPDSMLTVSQGIYGQRGLRLPNLPAAKKAKQLFWDATDGTVYVGDSTGTGGAGGISSIGTINSQTKSANGAVISGSSLVMQTADATYPGLMSSTQYSFLDSLKTHTSTIRNSLATGDSLFTKKNDSLLIGRRLQFVYEGVNAQTSGSNDSLLKITIPYDTIALATFGAGAGLAGDTAAFSTTSLYGSFYNDGSDTLIITKLIAVMQGTNDTLSVRIQWNDSINVSGTKLVNTPSPINNNYTGNSVTTFDNTKIPPGNWVWCDSPTVIDGRKPKYLSVTLIGYKKRKS